MGVLLNKTVEIPTLSLEELQQAKASLYGNIGNDFQPGNYAVKFYRDEYPVYFSKQFSFPALRLGTVPVPTNTGLDYKVPGEKIEYDDITITYRMDEKFDVWNFHYDWITKISHYDFERYPFDPTNDMAVHLLTNKQNIFKIFHFTGVFPVSLNPVEFDPEEGSDFLQMTVQYAFHDLQIRNIDV